MFEGKLPIPGEARARHAPFADEELHALSWSDLVARLAAARDLREVLRHAPVIPAATPAASFDPDSAQHLAQLHDPAADSSKPAVNPEPSADGKTTWAKDAMRTERTRPVSRGKA